MASKGTVEIEYASGRESEEEVEQADKESKGVEEKEVSENAGWADAMARILNKDLPSDQDPVLAKYKKGKREKSEKQEESRKRKSRTKEKHVMLEKDRVIPSIARTDHERNLMKIATRGVVQLFNAVNKHQREVESKLNKAPTEAKKAKVVESLSKTAFLDMLKSSSEKSRVSTGFEFDEQKKEKLSKSDTASSWCILRDDFMMGAKMRDWDQECDSSDSKRVGDDVSSSSSEDYDVGQSDEG